jgi:predicted ATPase
MSLEAKPYLREVTFRDPAAIDFSTYPWNIPAVRALDRLTFHADVTFLIGENGSGKSTVLEAIAVALGYAAEGGNRNHRFQTVESVSRLHHDLKLVRSFDKPSDGYFLRAESLFNLATYLEEVSFAPSLHERSHGEAFMQVLTKNFRGHGLYLLDEPEAALSPTRQLAALVVLHQLVRKKSQFIIATHSPILLSYPRARIMQFDDAGISEVKYEDTEHYAVTRDFLNHYPGRLARLLAEDGDSEP